MGRDESPVGVWPGQRNGPSLPASPHLLFPHSKAAPHPTPHYLLVWGVYRKEIETFLLSMYLPQVQRDAGWLDILIVGVVHNCVSLMGEFITSCRPGIKKCVPESWP